MRPAQTNTDAIIDLVSDWIAESTPNWTIDTLLTFPHRAIEMGEWVCRRLCREATEDNIAEICRVALNARKQGKLQIHEPKHNGARRAVTR